MDHGAFEMVPPREQHPQAEQAPTAEKTCGATHRASSGCMGPESVAVYTGSVLVSARPISTRLESLEKESGMGTERSRQPPARRDLSSCSPPSGAGAHRRGGCRRAAGFSITSRPTPRPGLRAHARGAHFQPHHRGGVRHQTEALAQPDSPAAHRSATSCRGHV
jgi:hypothetical protein